MAVGNGYLDFTGIAPQYAASTNPALPGNAAYDSAGNVLFAIIGGELNTANAGLVIISEGMETSVIRVPGRCDMWYAIGSKQVVSGGQYQYVLQHAVIKMINGQPHLVGSVVNDGVIVNLGFPGPNNPMNQGSLPELQSLN